MGKYNEDEIQYILKLARSDEYTVCVFGAGSLGKGSGREMLYNLDIHIDYYCDNNQSLIGLEIVDGIYCYDLCRLIENKLKTICFILVGRWYTYSIYRQLEEMGITHIVTYDDLLHLNSTVSKYFPFIAQNQIVIYTSITGDYDDISEPIDIVGGVDYYLISDAKPPKDSVYKWIDIETVVPPNITDNILRNRYCKILPHKIFSEYKYSIYIDGNIRLKGDVTKLFEKLGKSKIGVIGKESEESVYVHALRAQLYGLERADNIYKQVKKYWLQGMPADFGVFLCGVLIREHNNPICTRLMENWWEEYINTSRRDQISFSYILWVNGYTSKDIMLVSNEKFENALIKNDYFEYTYGHKRKK